MRKILVLSIISILLFSCSKEEEEYPFDQSPYVEFEGLEFYESTGINEPHLLELSFIVWDREGDIGLDNADIGYPYNLLNVVLDSENNFINHDSQFNPPFTSVPAFYAQDPDTYENTLFLQNELAEEFSLNQYPELNCVDYALTDESGRSEYLAYLNRYYYNILINFIDQDGNEYDFREIFNQDPTENCSLGDFNARLYDLSRVSSLRPLEIMPFKVRRRDEYSVIVSYIIPSMIWRIAFINNQFNVEVSVIDRELNESNIASSGLVTLQEITVE